jgi:putative FmdB family regulatory protein
MPTYEYLCQTCSHRFETWQKMTDEPLTVCPECGNHIRRVLFPAGVVFKGSGFYKTDYGNGKSSPSSASSDHSASKTESNHNHNHSNGKTESTSSSESKATESSSSTSSSTASATQKAS